MSDSIKDWHQKEDRMSGGMDRDKDFRKYQDPIPIPEPKSTGPENPMLRFGGGVVHPSHYNQGKIEVIDAIEDWKLGFNPGNAVKYIARHEYKGDPIENLEKARWYIDREIARLKAK